LKDLTMQKITLGKARYTIRDDREGFLEQVLKITGKHKKVRLQGGVSRNYPRYGAECSTAEYVRQYHIANAAIYTATDGKGKIYDHEGYVKSIDDFFQPMSTGITVPQGVDSMEVEA
jgi:hypothetical protein